VVSSSSSSHLSCCTACGCDASRARDLPPGGGDGDEYWTRIRREVLEPAAASIQRASELSDLAEAEAQEVLAESESENIDDTVRTGGGDPAARSSPSSSPRPASTAPDVAVAAAVGAPSAASGFRRRCGTAVQLKQGGTPSGDPLGRAVRLSAEAADLFEGAMNVATTAIHRPQIQFPIYLTCDGLKGAAQSLARVGQSIGSGSDLDLDLSRGYSGGTARSLARVLK